MRRHDPPRPRPSRAPGVAGADRPDHAEGSIAIRARGDPGARHNAGSAIGIKHVLEPHPAPVEIEVDESRWPGAILENEQLGRAVHAEPRIVHLLAVDAKRP